MPIQAPSWTEFLICPVCTQEFAANLRAPITLGCGHSICKNCLSTLNKKCPYDQTTITKELDNLPINYALLQLVTSSNNNNNNSEPEILPSIIQSLTTDELQCYQLAKRCIEELALYLKPNGTVTGLLSRPMQRKLVTLVNCQLVEDEGRSRSLRAARSLGERTVTELILQHQNPQQLSTNLWAAVRARGCQFLGPAMQEDVLKLVLIALDNGSALSRKVLVMYVVQRLEPVFPQASKTSIGHVVQLLYRASCFKVSKRDGDSSLMQLKEEFRTYKTLRREHDSQIVQIATEAGLRIAPDQWSALLYGDSNHKSDMQSIIDKQQNPQSFAQSVQELVIALQRTGDPANLSGLRGHLKNLAAIDPSAESTIVPTWRECADALDAVKHVVNGLIDFVQHHGNRKLQESGHLPHPSRYKISFCRDLNVRGNCPRGPNCTFAHSDDELEYYRAKMKKNAIRGAMHHSIKNDQSDYVTNNGPNHPTVNISHPTYPNQEAVSPRFSKPTPYRSENSLHHPPNTSQHLMPAYTGSPSSSSTPNLSTQLSPNQQQMGPPSMNNRFNYNQPNNNNNNNNNNNYQAPYVNLSPPPNARMGNNCYNNFRPPPLSAPPVPQQNSMYMTQEYKKQYSPYHNSSGSMQKNTTNGHFTMPPPAMLPSMNRRQDDYTNNNSGATGNDGKYMMNWQHEQKMNYRPNNCDKMKQMKSPNHLMAPRNSMSQNGSPINRQHEINQMEMNRNGNRLMAPSLNGNMMHRNHKTDEVDGGMNNMWNYQSHGSNGNASAFQMTSSQVSKDNFTRSDSILTSNTDDDYSYDNLTTTGKYGPIGIKTSPNTMDSMKNRQEWSGLQALHSKRYETNHESSAGDDTMRAIGNFNYNMDLQKKASDERTNPISNGGRSTNGQHGNFLNLSIGEMTGSSSTPRSAQSGKSDFQWSDPMQNWNGNENDYNLSVDTLENGMKKLFDFIDE